MDLKGFDPRDVCVNATYFLSGHMDFHPCIHAYFINLGFMEGWVKAN